MLKAARDDVGSEDDDDDSDDDEDGDDEGLAASKASSKAPAATAVAAEGGDVSLESSVEGLSISLTSSPTLSPQLSLFGGSPKLKNTSPGGGGRGGGGGGGGRPRLLLVIEGARLEQPIDETPLERGELPHSGRTSHLMREAISMQSDAINSKSAAPRLPHAAPDEGGHQHAIRRNHLQERCPTVAARRT